MRARLGLTEAVDVRLFEDPGRGAFEAFGCMGPRPKHGLFVIDPTGRVRRRYIGDEPLSAAWEVVDAVTSLIPRAASGK